MSSNLTPELLKTYLRYDSDTGLFTWIKYLSNKAPVGSIAGTMRNNGYINISVLGELHRAHRLVWLYVYGVLPTCDIDHINRVRNDNRLCNLRLVTRSENLHNNSCAGYSFNKLNKTFDAHIALNSVKKHLGCYKTQLDARAAYLRAKKVYHLSWNPLASA